MKGWKKTVPAFYLITLVQLSPDLFNSNSFPAPFDVDLSKFQCTYTLSERHPQHVF